MIDIGVDHDPYAAIARDPARFRILTGDRPTGPLHIGHYFGTLENRVRLQDLGVDLLVLIADYQTITDRDAPASGPTVLGQVADYLAVGIDPARSTIFPTARWRRSISSCCRSSAWSPSRKWAATPP